MAKLSMLVSSTSQTVNIFIQDSSVSTGAGKTGLVFNTASLVAYYALPKAAPVAITLATLASATAAYSSGGFFELDATNMPGLYRFDIPNAALASGIFCTIMLKGATNMAPCVLEIEITAVDNQSTAYGLTLAKTTNITGFNDIAASAVVSSGAITTSGGAVSTVTTVTNQLTAAQVATGIWQDATAGDFTTANSIGKSLYTSGVVPGGSGGLFISGTNSGTTVVGAFTCTGTFTVSDGFIVSRSTSNSAAATFTGSGSGNGITITGGAAVTSTAAGNGLVLVGGASSSTSGGVGGVGLKSTGGVGSASNNGAAEGVTIAAGGTITVSGANAMSLTGSGALAGIIAIGGATGNGIKAVGGGTSGDGITVTTTSGDGLSLLPTAGHGLTCTGQGTTKHGINARGGATTSHGISATGGGVGHGILATSGGGATGDGIQAISAATNGNGVNFLGKGTGAGEIATGGLTGVGCNWIGGGTSGQGVLITTTSGDGVAVTPTAGNGLTVTANGTSKHGAVITGGTAGIGDGIKAVAGTGGVDIRGNITGNITGNLSGSAGSVTAQVTANATSWAGGTIPSPNVTGVPLVDDKYLLGTIYTTPATAGIMDVNVKNVGNQTATAAAGVTFPSSIASPTNITAGTITTVTNLTNAATAGDFTATMKTSVTTATNAATTVGITSNRKKGSTTPFEFLMQDSTTGAPKTGLTVTSKISKDGGAAASTSNAVTEIGLGQYQIVLTGTEMTMNNGFLQCTATGALTFNLSIQTQP